LKYQNIFFDLDRTISDPREGIINGLNYCLNEMGVSLPEDFNLDDEKLPERIFIRELI
jgi:phosphoglycolate phosphatase-like HAD superfamily hydrolase